MYVNHTISVIWIAEYDKKKKYPLHNHKWNVINFCISCTTVVFSFPHYSFISMFQIPEELSLHVPHLKSLNLSHNQITTLPHSFSLLFHLRVLDLSYNRLKVVPEAITGLEKIKTLNLANNNISELPTTMTQLTSVGQWLLCFNIETDLLIPKWVTGFMVSGVNKRL